MELPRWKCHKEVEGFQIDRIVGNSLIGVDANMFVIVTDEYMEKHKPYAGGYFVQYLDGYKSFSPASAFEDGYSQARRVLHIKLPESLSPSIKDMQAVMDMFMGATTDPIGGVVVTGHGITANIEEVLMGDECDTVVVSLEPTTFKEVLKGFKAAKKEADKVAYIFDESKIEWHTVEIFPEDKTLMVNSYKNHLFLNNVQGAARLIRGRSVKHVVLHSLRKEDLVPDVRAALECAVMTHTHNVGTVAFEEQP